MIEIKNLKKSYGNKTILHDISFDIQKGDVVTILGPSGSGKTTLLRSLNFLELPDSGVLEFNGRSINYQNASSADQHYVRAHTAFVFQNFNLFLNKNVLENVTLGLTVGRKIKKDEAKAIALEALKSVGMSDHLDAYPLSLSGGQQQRVAIARAIAAKPDVILFDEPTSALDPSRVNEVLSIITDLAKQGITMAIVTHEMAFARKVSSKVIFMDGGYIVDQGNSEHIFSTSTNARTRRFVDGLDLAPEYII